MASGWQWREDYQDSYMDVLMPDGISYYRVWAKSLKTAEAPSLSASPAQSSSNPQTTGEVPSAIETSQSTSIEIGNADSASSGLCLNPSSAPIYLRDIPPDMLSGKISQRVGVQQLSRAPPVPDPANYCRGIIYGDTRRVFVPLPVATTLQKDKPKWVIFLVDTGAPGTIVSKEVCTSLGLRSTRESVFIRGRKVAVERSDDPKLDGISLLGMDVLNALGVAHITWHWKTGSFFMSFSDNGLKQVQHELASANPSSQKWYNPQGSAWSLDS